MRFTDEQWVDCYPYPTWSNTKLKQALAQRGLKRRGNKGDMVGQLKKYDYKQ